MTGFSLLLKIKLVCLIQFFVQETELEKTSVYQVFSSICNLWYDQLIFAKWSESSLVHQKVLAAYDLLPRLGHGPLWTSVPKNKHHQTHLKSIESISTVPFTKGTSWTHFNGCKGIQDVRIYFVWGLAYIGSKFFKCWTKKDSWHDTAWPPISKIRKLNSIGCRQACLSSL